MTHPPATCELCGDTGLYSPSALPCPKGCPEVTDIIEALIDADIELKSDGKRNELYARSIAEITFLRQALSEAEQRSARSEAEKTGLLQSLQHHTGCDHGVMAIRMLVDRAEGARVKALEEASTVAKAEYKRHCTGSGFDSQPSRSTAHSILEAIRALKDEVR